MRVIWQSEIDPYASAVLKKHWPTIPNHGDIRSIRAGTVERPDVLCGGFPCQDISNAGKRAGIDGERSGLWSEYARVIGELRPRYVIVENVAALLGRGLERVLGDLASLGYDAEWSSVSACAVGAPHMRDRVLLVAYPSGCGRQGVLRHRPERSHHTPEGWPTTSLDSSRGAVAWLERATSRIPAFFRDADGLPNRVELVAPLRALGNAIVPQIAEVIGRAILSAEGVTA